jgi:hypothetical protein
MPTPPEKDSIYGSSKNTNEYKVHLIFLYQANPETGIPYGHFNFLVPAEKEVAQAEAVKPAGSSSSLTEKNKGNKNQKDCDRRQNASREAYHTREYQRILRNMVGFKQAITTTSTTQ